MPDTASSYYTPPEEQFQNAPLESAPTTYNPDAYPYGQAPQEGDIAVAPETGGELQTAPEEGEQLALNPPRMPRQPSTPRTPPNYDIPPSERPTAAQKNSASQSQRLGGGQGQGYGQPQRIGLSGLESWAQKNGYESPTVRNEDGSINQEATDQNAHRLAQWIGSPRQQFQDAPPEEKLRILAERGDPNAMKAYVNYLQHDAELSGRERQRLQKMKADGDMIISQMNTPGTMLYDDPAQGYAAIMDILGQTKHLEARDASAKKKADAEKIASQVSAMNTLHAGQTAAGQGAGDAWTDWQKKNMIPMPDGGYWIPKPDGSGGTHIKGDGGGTPFDPVKAWHAAEAEAKAQVPLGSGPMDKTKHDAAVHEKAMSIFNSAKNGKQGGDFGQPSAASMDTKRKLQAEYDAAAAEQNMPRARAALAAMGKLDQPAAPTPPPTSQADYVKTTAAPQVTATIQQLDQLEAKAPDEVKQAIQSIRTELKTRGVLADTPENRRYQQLIKQFRMGG